MGKVEKLINGIVAGVLSALFFFVLSFAFVRVGVLLGMSSTFGAREYWLLLLFVVSISFLVGYLNGISMIIRSIKSVFYRFTGAGECSKCGAQYSGHSVECENCGSIVNQYT